MRIAVVSDIHGNLTAFEAVLADLRDSAPDLVLHGGDLADGGAGGAQIVDRIRELGWPGVLGNTDDMLARPESLDRFAAGHPQAAPLFQAAGEMAAWARERLGDERLRWLSGLPLAASHEGVTLVHASPGDPWKTPPEGDLETAFAELPDSATVYGHIHRPFVRNNGARLIANSGSVGLPYDRDPRACYLLLNPAGATIRRVPYDIDRETRALLACGIPHASWVAAMLAAGAFVPLG